MTDPTPRDPRPERVPCRVLRAFALGHERYVRGDLVLLRRAEAERLAQEGLVEAMRPQPLAGYRRCLAF